MPSDILRNSLDEAWCSGFFDGEGCIYIRKHKRNSKIIYELRASASQSYCVDPLLKLKEMLDGHIVTPTASRNYWEWVACGTGAAFAVQRLLPFLIVKKQQALIALSFQSRRKGRGVYLNKKEKELDEIDYLRLKELKIVVNHLKEN